jgi:hypothetical protein
MDRQKIKAYLDHFLPREIIGPVIIVFSLEGVISGIFAMYVPQAYETMAWTAIFILSVGLVAHWGTTGEASEELEEKMEQLE